MTVVATINNRRIWEKQPIGTYTGLWYIVELRGPTSDKGERLFVFRKCDTLAHALAEAERLGPMTEQPDA
jgi:hypothetical protein